MKETAYTVKKILLVDDEEHILNISRLYLQSSGMNDVMVLNDSRKVMPYLADHPASVIVLDLHMPHLSGVELLPKIVMEFPQIPVIVMTANDEVENVVTCMKMGAFDYLAKPVDSRRLAASVKKALEISDLSSEISSLKNRLLTDKLDNPGCFASIVTGNKQMRALFQYLEVVAVTRQPIMITGETGVGKDLFAEAVHELSGCAGEFVSVNVAGLDDNMFSDTLFGHKKGAFTGADQNREGLIARAGGGTLFLDEIGDLSETSQIKLLRLLQQKEYYQVGSDMVRKSDARVVMATNRDLQKLIAAGKFRNDLYYRLFAHQVQIPPLRERLDDLPVLLDFFLEKAATVLNRKKPGYPQELLTLLSLYHFPGNVRELEAMVFDAMVRCTSKVISMDRFRSMVGGDERPAAPVEKAATKTDESPLIGIFGHYPTISEMEAYMISEAMTMTNGNQGIAATILGMGRPTLNKRLKAKQQL